MKSKGKARYTVVGQLCVSRAEAVRRLALFREADPSVVFRDAGYKWGLVDIHDRAGRVTLPPPPALLVRLEGLLGDHVVQRSKAGKAALRLVRAALKPKRR